MTHGRMFLSQYSQVRSQEEGIRRMSPPSTAARASRAMPETSANHCGDSIGSIGSPLRWEWPTLWTWGSTLTSRPSASSRSTTRRRASKRSRPSKSGTRLGGHPAVEIDHAHARQVVAAADLVVVRIVERRHLDQPGAEPGVDMLVGDQPETPAENGQPGRAAGEVAIALVFRVKGDGGVPEHRLGPRRGHDERLLVRGAFPRAAPGGRQGGRGGPRTSRFSTSRSETAVRSTGDQLTMCSPR